MNKFEKHNKINKIVDELISNDVPVYNDHIDCLKYYIDKGYSKDAYCAKFFKKKWGIYIQIDLRPWYMKWFNIKQK